MCRTNHPPAALVGSAALSAAVSRTAAPVLQVEDYMTDIITKMRSELREILQGSVTDYPSKLREKWLFDWPSQIILVVNQIYWCQEVEEAFAAQGKGNKMALAVSATVKTPKISRAYRGRHSHPALVT